MNRIIARLLRKSEQSSRSHERRSSYIVTRAEVAPCNCPDACERDHGND